MGFIHPSVFVNTLTVVAGSTIGILIGKSIPDRFRSILFQAVGLTTVGIGVKMTLSTSSFIVVLLALASGALVGELVKLEDKIASIGRFSKDPKKFSAGFVAASTLFLVGPMTIIGSIQAGLINDGTLIYVKSTLDFISSIVLASLYGLGVLFSALAVFVVQGSLVLFASKLGFLTESAYLSNLTGVGGLIVVAIGIRLLELKDVKTGNLLPALAFSPLFDYLARVFKL
ncbi:DUF554 domain-containing protein [Pseudothermotoga thermarum]|uniref:DUF554 domain-containing protein n=1 Tax=Pseudothermotoga thermarum TaxID=119394 RepID=UPI001FDEF47E|nr:DUF554 domain-containing protein [Pseudothermotoga thermarum]